MTHPSQLGMKKGLIAFRTVKWQLTFIKDEEFQLGSLGRNEAEGGCEVEEVDDPDHEREVLGRVGFLARFELWGRYDMKMKRGPSESVGICSAA